MPQVHPPQSTRVPDSQVLCLPKRDDLRETALVGQIVTPNLRVLFHWAADSRDAPNPILRDRVLAAGCAPGHWSSSIILLISIYSSPSMHMPSTRFTYQGGRRGLHVSLPCGEDANCIMLPLRRKNGLILKSCAILLHRIMFF